MTIQIVRFKSGLSPDEVSQRFAERAGRYRNVSGLIQKYYSSSLRQENTGDLRVGLT